MCGRYASARRDADIAGALAVQEIVDEETPPSWNVAPQQDIRVVLERTPRGAPEDAEPVRQLRRVRWGLVPAWAKDDEVTKVGARMINARSESLTEKPAFKRAAAKRRCLVPMDGFYEWRKNADGTKTPFFLHAGGDLIAAAGLYELRPDPEREGEWLWTATVATRAATDTLGEIHERCPVLVTPDRVDAWLDPHLTDLDDVAAILAALPEPHLEPREVGKAVGNVRNDGPHLVEPAAAG
ncbi:SOS response-associated peptidase [Cellulomonas cellasea]|uniref:Abasic site processing protein n=1 Tax=Cellulomonas cellasea TaxID=43670 RepID=A0A7W4UC39_9CELL|nr:SOS response-associated peptidase [Cellulomonas cellasea]MBB2921463.1 putative SOS response-associated peptidase YedK [Cellulomonas cellasea]